MSHGPTARTRWSMALALIVFGARLVVFDYAGSPLPYYDQWIAEFYNLFFAIIAGGNPSALFSWHNEHILFTTRILSLFGFLINGYWDVAFLAACSAAIRAIVAATAFRLLTQYADHKSTALIWGLCVLAFALPVSGYNALSGLQVSFYLTDLSAIAAIGLLLNWPGCRLGPPLLVLLSLAGLFSMASGLVIPIVTLGVHLATRMVRQGFWPAWIITGIAAIAYTIPILARGQLPDAAPRKSRGLNSALPFACSLGQYSSHSLEF